MSAYQGGLSKITIGTDNSVTGNGSGNQVVIPIDDDLIGLDFTEDMFRNSISGTLIVGNKSAWDAKFGGVQGTEWISFTFNSVEYEYDDDGKITGSSPYTITQRFKVYKISQSISETNTLTTYVLNFTSYQFLVDSVKFERHLNNNHIGPIASDYDDDNRENFSNQDYGFVNKIFDAAGFDLDVTVNDKNGTPPLDIEATGNWINWIPSYADNRFDTDILGSYYVYNNYSRDANPDPEKTRPKRVFEILNELAENAVSKENPNASNFFVWHDLRGWHFRSVDSFLRNRESEVDRVYSYDIADGSPKEVSRIIDLKVIKQIDFMNLLHQQALSSKVIYYELNPDNPLASYYLTLPQNIGGLTRVIGPAGINNTIGDTVIQTQAVVESGLSYDYLLDYNKWSMVEQYPLIQGFDNQYTDYTFPSFLEVPPKYISDGIGGGGWFNNSINEYDNEFYGWNRYSRNTTYTFSQTKPHEYFKTKFLRQTELDGEKFRVVHDQIKTPIIEALKKYYNAALQRMFYEHNLVIMNGLNFLESGEGTLGRGPDKQYCEYCVTRDEVINQGLQYLIELIGQDAVNEWRALSTTQLDWENTLLIYGELTNTMTTCTKKYRDTRELFLGGVPPYYQGTYNPFESSLEDYVDFVESIPIIEEDVVPRLNENYVNQTYPKCFSREPLLPYNGDPVDCVTLQNLYNEIPSECGLIRQHLGPEYVSPAVRGWYGSPINLRQNIFWNGYWINPRYGLPNIGNFIDFFQEINYESNYARWLNFFESRLFLKDFIEPGDDATSLRGSFDSTGKIPAHFNTFESVYSSEGMGNFNPQIGDTQTSRVRWSVSKQRNPWYYFVKTCSIPQLCGGTDTSSETIEMPYVSSREWTYQVIETGEIGGGFGGGVGLTAEAWVLTNTETDTLSVDFPAEYAQGTAYNYGSLSTIPFNLIDYQGNILDNSYREFLQQFGLLTPDAYYATNNNIFTVDNTFSNNTYETGIADLKDSLNKQGIYTNHFPNQNLGLYDNTRPIYNQKDWQNFLDCNGTCVGGVDNEGNILYDNSKSVEYAKYCSYAWNRYWSTPKEQPMYRRAQVALIQSQEIEITVPNDMNLRIGHLVRVDIPKSTSLGEDGEILRQSRVNPISGKYLVTGIRRSFNASNQQAMRVRLNRDSLPYDPNTQST